MNTNFINLKFFQIFAALLLPATLIAQKQPDLVVNPNNFKIYSVGYEYGVSSAYLKSGYIDRDGFLWIGGQNNLEVFDGYQSRIVHYKDLANNSLPIEHVNYFMEDKQGDLWMCGDHSLYCYDRSGDKIISYDVEPNATYNISYYRIYEDLGQRYWICTSEGLYILDYKLGRFSPTGIRYPQEWKIEILDELSVEAKDGTLWLPVPDSGLYMYDPSRGIFRNYRHDPANPASLSSDLVSNMVIDKDGYLWIATWGGGLNKLIDRGKGIFEQYRFDTRNENSIMNDTLGNLFIDRSGDLWICGRNGFSKYKKETNDFLSYRVPFPVSPSSSKYMDGFIRIMEDGDGFIWMHESAGRGAVCFDPVQEKLYQFTYDLDNPQSLSGSNQVVNIHEGIGGTIWVINGQGINFIVKNPNKPFISFKHERFNPVSLSHPEIFSLFIDREGRLWTGSSGGILNACDHFDITGPVRFRHFPPLDIQIGGPRVVMDFLEDNHQTIWIAAYGGLFQYHRKTNTFKQFTRNQKDGVQFGNFLAWGLYMDRKSNIWIGTDRGLFIYDTYKNILYQSPVGGLYVYCEDSKGNMWLGDFYGLSRMSVSEVNSIFNSQKTTSCTEYKNDPEDVTSLSSNQVVNIHEDQQGRIWIGTTAGLNLYDPEADSFISFGLENGLPSEGICGILEDDHGNLWLSTLNGICKLVLTEGISHDIIQFVQRFSTHDGIQGPFFHEKACLKNEDGWMFFGGTNGLTVFHPDSIRKDTNVPAIHITNLTVNDKPFYSYNHSLLKNKTIKLSHKQNFLSFEYVALSFINSEKNQYKYMMEGLDADWVDAGTRRFAEYRDLKPGTYTFRVIGSNSDGTWNEEGSFLDIFIHPPWYSTITAYIIYILLLVFAVLGIIRWRTIRLIKDKQELEHQVRERTAMIQEQKDELEQQKEELQITLDNLQQTQAKLIQSEKLASLGGLVAGVAHEINTPVGISVTAASSLAEETRKMADLYKENKISRANFKEYLTTAKDSARLILTNMERAAAMVQSFKQVSVDQSTERQRKFKLKVYIEDVIWSLYPKLKGRDINFELKIDNQLELDSFPGAFSQIITNLVLNSLSHGFDEDNKGTIEIKTGLDDNQLILEYSDNGKGIPEENMAKIFEPFFTTNKKIGTGLGLHIVYNLISQKLNGSIECQSELEKGSRFIITIPLKK